MLLKKISFFTYFITSCCFAVQAPSNTLQVEYQKRIVQETKISDSFSLDLEAISNISNATYQYLDELVRSFYNELDFSTSITDSTFTENSHYELFSLPLVSANEKRFQLEVFGYFSEAATQYLSNLSTDQTLSDYFTHSDEINISDADLSLGVGIRFSTSESSNIKILISNDSLPGYGGSTALIGFEKKF